jgi:hypothetical protein
MPKLAGYETRGGPRSFRTLRCSTSRFAYSFSPGIPSAHCACIRGSVPPRFLQFASASFVAASGLDRGPARACPADNANLLPMRMRYREISRVACRGHYFWIHSALSLTPSKASLSTSPLGTLLPGAHIVDAETDSPPGYTG